MMLLKKKKKKGKEKKKKKNWIKKNHGSTKLSGLHCVKAASIKIHGW